MMWSNVINYLVSRDKFCLARLLAIAILSHTTAWGSQPSAAVPTESPLLGEILITATRFEDERLTAIPNMIVIERAAIQASGSRDLGELLRGQVNNAADPAHPIMDMRGFGSTAGANTLILLNGHRLNNSSDLASPDLSTIDLTAVQRVEIIPGSAGTLFGNQAVGGIINIITTTRHPRLNMQVGGGSFGSYEARVSAANKTTKQFSYGISARKWDDNQEREQSNSKRHNLSWYVTQDYDSGQISFMQLLQHETMQLPGSLFRNELAIDRYQSVAAYAGDYNDTNTTTNTLSWHQSFNPAWALAISLAYRNNDSDFKLSSRGWPGSPSSQNREIWQLLPRLTNSFSIHGVDLQLIYGAEWEYVDYQLRSTFGRQAETQHIYAAYSQVVADIGQNWQVTSGLRYAQVTSDINSDANYDLDDALVVGSVGVTYQPTVAWRLFARWDQNYRFATVDEHTNVLTGQPVGLDNQKGDSYEIGTNYQSGPLDFHLTAYELRLRNEISFDASSFFNINLPTTRRRGLIVGMTWGMVPSWTLGTDYTYTNSRITAGPFTGNDLPLVPEHGGRIFIDYASTDGFGLRLTNNWLSARTLAGDFANDFAPLADHTIIDLAGRYQRGPWLFTARLDNLLDRRYNGNGAVGYDEMFQKQDAYFPANGRSFWLTLSYTPPDPW